ncbi:MAG: thioredoxin family protein [Dehalococcoidia bacterium]|nr:thioredoxin family protein [Dehalococcoidia bacterium]
MRSGPNRVSRLSRAVSTRSTTRTTRFPRPTSRRSRRAPTLVWFSAPWCHFCSQMSGFAHEAAEEFEGDVHFVEKSVELERDAVGRYGVRGTPTFVLIDAAGEPIGRFGFQPDAGSFRATIDEVLQEAG